MTCGKGHSARRTGLSRLRSGVDGVGGGFQVRVRGLSGVGNAMDGGWERAVPMGEGCPRRGRRLSRSTEWVGRITGQVSPPCGRGCPSGGEGSPNSGEAEIGLVGGHFWGWNEGDRFRRGDLPRGRWLGGTRGMAWIGGVHGHGLRKPRGAVGAQEVGAGVGWGVDLAECPGAIFQIAFPRCSRQALGPL